MREIKLRMQVLQGERHLPRAAHAKRCHWSEGCNNNVGVTAGKSSHNASNARGVTSGKMGRNSSIVVVPQWRYLAANCYEPTFVANRTLSYW